ncbi:MAG: hypothetical protein AAF989_02880, partial [Planctomycetota bacterium]
KLAADVIHLEEDQQFRSGQSSMERANVGRANVGQTCDRNDLDGPKGVPSDERSGVVNLDGSEANGGDIDWNRLASQCSVENLLVPVMRQGKVVGQSPTLTQIRERARDQQAMLTERQRSIDHGLSRRESTQQLVYLDRRLWDLKMQLLDEVHEGET